LECRVAGQRGSVLLLVLLLVLGLACAWLALAWPPATHAARDAVTERALAQAREALIAYAVDRPITSTVGPGYLPCPDLDNDGWAESTCGSLDGASGQAARLGRLPWKTLGLPDLRDGAGERLWYAVSTKYKGLLNCAASAGCLDMTPGQALGTLTLRAPSGSVVHDGRAASGAVALVIAPGAPLERLHADGAGSMQSRACAAADCDASGTCVTTPPQSAATCDPRNYLDRAPAGATLDEDNADFVDRSDSAGRPANGNGFIAGPVLDAQGRVRVNDRIIPIAYEDVMPRIMHRVALEAAQCLRFYASRPENAQRYPLPVAACARGTRFGTLPDAPFTLAPPTMLPRWWRTSARTPENLSELPTHDDACRLALAPNDPGPLRTWPPASPADEGSTPPSPSWWRAWRPYVFVALAAAHDPDAALPADCARDDTCIRLVDASGRTLDARRQAAVIVASGCPGGDLCANDACDVIRLATGVRDLHAVVALP
jgi:type II secretory pathway pseudopilin PulG